MRADFTSGGKGRGSHLSLVVPPSRLQILKGWAMRPVLPAVVFVVASLIGVAFLAYWLPSENVGSNGFFDGFERVSQGLQIGGTASNAAANAVDAQPSDSISAAALDAAVPKYEWIDGATPVPLSSLKHPVVGVTAVGTAIETAVHSAPRVCSFGLSVTSFSDPLITQDHLPGPGTYYQVQNGPCVANQAPTSSWMTWIGS